MAKRHDHDGTAGLAGIALTADTPATAQERVLAALRRAIVDRRLLPGDRLRQDAVARELGVSHVPVREAFKVLHAEGLLLYQRNRGYTVRGLTAAEMEELLVLLSVLEEEAVRRAMPRTDEALIEQLGGEVEAMEAAAAADDVTQFAAHNNRFHFLLFERSGLPRLVHFLQVLWQSSAPYLGVFFTDADARRSVQREHGAILAAVAAGDTDRVVELMHEHRENGVPELLERLERA